MTLILECEFRKEMGCPILFVRAADERVGYYETQIGN
jgi:hypothetical protein